jgi:hypothetical protein
MGIYSSRASSLRDCGDGLGKAIAVDDERCAGGTVGCVRRDERDAEECTGKLRGSVLVYVDLVYETCTGKWLDIPRQAPHSSVCRSTLRKR